MTTQSNLQYSVGNADYLMLRGDTFRLKVHVKNQYGAEKNITGSKVWFTVKCRFTDQDALAVSRADSTDASGDVVITDATRGYVDVRMQAFKTVTFPDTPVALVYDVQVLDASGDVITVERGLLTVTPDVTRTTT